MQNLYPLFVILTPPLSFPKNLELLGGVLVQAGVFSGVSCGGLVLGTSWGVNKSMVGLRIDPNGPLLPLLQAKPAFDSTLMEEAGSGLSSYLVSPKTK